MSQTEASPQQPEKPQVPSLLKSIEKNYEEFKKKTLLMLTLKASWACITTLVVIYFNYDEIRAKTLSVPPIQQKFCSMRVLNADTDQWPPGKINQTLIEAVDLAKLQDWKASLNKLEELTSQNLAIPGIHQIKSGVFLEQGRQSEAKHELRRELDLLDCLDVQSDVGLTERQPYFIATGQSNSIDEIRALLKRSRALVHYNLACYYASLAEGEKALDQLQKSIDLGYRNAEQLGRDRFFQSIRETVRYQQILARIRN